MYKKRKRTLKNMKYPLLTKSAFLLFATGAMAGCSDSEEGLLPSSRPAKPGETIQFGIDGPATTRTHYTEDSLQIDWDLKDKIVIYSPQAATSDGTKHEAFYMISNVYPEDDPIHQFHGDFVPVASAADNDTTENDGVGLKWTKNADDPAQFAYDQYTFYGAYPAKHYNSVEDSTFHMQYITNQVNTVVSVNNGKYETEPDMLNAYMMAKKTVKPQEDHVLLSFDPIMTTLKIDVTAGGYELGTGIIQPITVTGVSVMMQGVIAASEFSYRITADHTDGDPTDSRGELTNTPKNGKESVFVGILQDDKRYVELNEGETISLMAFLPPIKDLKMNKIQVKIHTAEGFDFVTTSTSGASLKEQSRIYIHLPDVSVNDKKNNNWISQLDPNIKITQLSIPGAKLTEHEDEELNGAEMQALFDMGIRAFEANELSHYNHYPHSHNHLNLSADKIKQLIKEDFIILWSGDDLKGFLNEENIPWKEFSFNMTMQEAIGHAIVIQKGPKFFFQLGAFQTITSNRILPINNYNSINDFLLSYTEWDEKDWNVILTNKWTWGVQFIEKDADYASLKNEIYKKIVRSTEQKSTTGIVVIPDVNANANSGIATYDDLLIQSIIDCNFKFILDRAN